MKNILVFPKRGNPPKCPKGYKSTGDPYIFTLEYISCKLRKVETSICKFKKETQVHRCQYINQLISPKDCYGCPLTHSEREFMSLQSIDLEKLKQEYPQSLINCFNMTYDE